MTVNGKPEYGRRLIPQILDRLALADPDRIVYSIASFYNDKPSFRDITAREFTKAVDKTAWWLNEQLKGDASLLSKVEALGYIGPRKYRSPAKVSSYGTDASQMTFAMSF
jgi:hypothetical protein